LPLQNHVGQVALKYISMRFLISPAARALLEYVECGKSVQLILMERDVDLSYSHFHPLLRTLRESFLCRKPCTARNIMTTTVAADT